MSQDTPEDRSTTPEENRAIYNELVALELEDHMLETMIFALALDDEELELSRNEVSVADASALATAYQLMPTWDQRCAVAYVAQDIDAPELDAMRLDVLGAPVRDPLSIRHIAVAASLAWLQGDADRTVGYLDDLDLLRERLAVWRTV